MKLGWMMGYWGAGPRPEDLRNRGRSGPARPGLDLDGRGIRLGRADSACLVWRRVRRNRGWAPAIVQMSARTPTAVGMAAMTLDHLSGGRLILGLGLSGPQVVEGWYGEEYGQAAGPDP